MIGMGAGKAYCTVMISFVDKATGEEIGRMNFEGELVGGFYGGDKSEAAKGVVKAIMQYLKSSHRFFP